MLVDVYVAVEPTLIAAVGTGTVADALTRALVATVVLLPPSILMGGTLPVLGQYLVAQRAELGRTGSALYAINTLINTLGSALGALAAGFLLPVVFGYLGAYLVAVGLDLAVGLAALSLAYGRAVRPSLAASSPGSTTVAPVTEGPAVAATTDTWFAGMGLRTVWVLAAASGLLTLAVEVIWTRLFSQVLQNSAYTYALVLAAFLLALALGAVVANLLTRVRRVAPDRIVAWLLLGALLPYLLRVLERRQAAPGQTIGRLVAINALGGIVGALVAGFVLLPLVGAWRAMLLVAAAYALLGAVVAWPRTTETPAWGWRAVAGVGLAAAVGLALVVPDGLAVVRLNPDSTQRLVEVRDGPQATVSVVADADHLFLRADNHYVLGGTRSLDAERNQSVVPLLTAHPDPRSVFYLGMGTGITAGAGLAFDVDRIVVCELIDEVVHLAQAHFQPWINGLFDDPRAEVRAEDGRTCLRRTDETFDLIVSDLFNPWEAGTGNLYTKENHEIARSRLEPGGAFVQWVPLYQVTDTEFGSIAATMDVVFDQVTVWRGDHFGQRSIVALVGTDDPAPLDPAIAVRQGRALLDDDDGLPDAFFEAIALRMYVGNLTASGHWSDRELNTDRSPTIEFQAPVSQRAVWAGEDTFLIGSARERLYDQLFEDVPFRDDPYLSQLTDRQLGYVEAGRSYSRFRFLTSRGNHELAQP